MGYFDAYNSEHFRAACAEAVAGFAEGKRVAEATGEAAVYVSLDAPAWLRDAVREACDGHLCDWTPDAMRAAAVDLAEVVAEGSDPDEAAHAWADTRVIYHAENARWYAHARLASYWLEAAQRDGLLGDRGGVADAVTVAHYYASRDAYERMHAAIVERAEAIAEAESRAEEAAALDALALVINAECEAEHAALEAAQAADDAEESARNAAAFAIDPNRGRASEAEVDAYLAARARGLSDAEAVDALPARDGYTPSAAECEALDAEADRARREGSEA